VKTAKANRDEVREHSLTIPMSKIEKETIQEMAQKYGLTMAAWARMVISEKINQK
jgi:hypothetical protein